MKKTRYLLALLVAVGLGVSGNYLSADYTSGYYQEAENYAGGAYNQEENAGPQAFPMSCERPCPPQACRPPMPAPCQMPCCPPNYEPIARNDCLPRCNPPCEPSLCPPMCDFGNCGPCYTPVQCCTDNYRTFYIGGYFYRLDLSASRRNARGVEPFFGDAHEGNRHHLKGTLRGGTVGFEHNRPCRWFENIEFNWASGRVRGNHHSCRNQGRYVHNYLAYLRLGYNLSFCDNSFSFIPYSGLAYRYNNHHIHHAQTSLRYRSFYVPVGLRLAWEWDDCFSFGLNGEWLIPIDSEVKVSCWNQIRWGLKKRPGYTIEMPLKYYWCNKAFEFVLQPFYRRFVDGSSRCLSNRRLGFNVRLPKLTNQEWGGRIYLGFGF